MPRSFALALAAALATCPTLSAPAHAANWPQWRGPERTGIYEETDLLDEWPENGPELLWQLEGLGGGYSTPSIVGGR